MNRILFSLGAAALLCGGGCETKGPTFNPDESGSEAFQQVALTNRIDKAWLQPPTEPYRLGPGDAIEVEVLGDAASRSTLLIGPDGKIYFSILPGTLVWGLTLNETRSLLQKQLGQYLRKRRGDMTLPAFARKIGISSSSLHRMEMAEQNVTLTTLERLLKRLKCNVADVFNNPNT